MIGLRLEAVVESDFRSEGFAIQIETIVLAIETVVVAGKSEAEGSGESFGSSPSDTGTEGQSPTHGVFSAVNRVAQIEVTSQIQEQGELLADGATHVTNVRLKGQFVDCQFFLLAHNFELVLGEAVASTQSNGPMVVDVVANFRSDAELGVVLVKLGVDAATNPPTLSIS